MRYSIEVNKYGTRWFKEGTEILHRLDGPAVESNNGRKEYWVNGLRHREDGPADVQPNGDKYWYLNGKLHREYGPAVECANGTKKWFLNGVIHRLDGPAVVFTTHKAWYVNGKCHREDGPAVVYSEDMMLPDEYYWDGVKITKAEFFLRKLFK